MDTEMSSKQLVRLTPDAVRAIRKYRSSVKRETGTRLSINTAINNLICDLICYQSDAVKKNQSDDATY